MTDTADKIFYIYVHQNKKNLKIYVGITTDVKTRWNDQRSAAFNKNHACYDEPLYRSIRKHTWDEFSHTIIEVFLNKLEALDAEKFWIEFFRSNIKIFGSNYGYNQSAGGEFIAEKGWRARKSLSERNAGSKNPMFGKPRSDETKKKISDTKRKNPLSEEKRKRLSDKYKIIFSEEQVKSICSDVRSQSEIAKSHGVSRIVIKRILVENGIHNSSHRKNLKTIDKEQLIQILKKDLSCKETAIELGISTITLFRKIKSLLNEESFVNAKKSIKEDK